MTSIDDWEAMQAEIDQHNSSQGSARRRAEARNVSDDPEVEGRLDLTRTAVFKAIR